MALPPLRGIKKSSVHAHRSSVHAHTVECACTQELYFDKSSVQAHKR